MACYVCMYVHSDSFVNTSAHKTTAKMRGLSTHICMYACYACMYVCMYVCMYAQSEAFQGSAAVCMYVCYVCMLCMYSMSLLGSVCMYVCMQCMRVSIYVCMYVILKLGAHTVMHIP
jgi:hypothetical protein